MKEKPSYHPKKESRALQTRFGGIEERSIKYESDPQTANFISVLPLIQKEPGNGQDIIGKISMPAFEIIYLIVKSTYVSVYDQPGDEAILVKQMVSDRTLPEYHIDLISESSGVALLELSRSIRRFLRILQNPWQSPAGTSPEQPQIATMKEKPSYHPKKESRALQTRFGGIEERSIKYEVDPQTANFISVLPLIQKEPGNGQDIIGISRCQLFKSST
ncbi:hypothetical protein F2Q70_00025725 [Brassica cretica]|uniref:Uncharacterized protein n=1 Tax=Brassica cretica TaxID=69181 RepID=A0A8S9L5M6_BRACR|nr:hypothetical protein F2Q70_00025725 [Brassica cretica]